MKTFLYCTTALIAAAVVAGTASAQTAAKKPNEKITLQLGGYFHASYVIGDEARGQRPCPIATAAGGCADPNGGGAFGVAGAIPFGGVVQEPGRGRRFQRVGNHEAEVHFRGQTTLDNGLTLGAFIQLELETQGDIVDESYIYFSGSFGRVEYGSMDSVAEQMYYGAPPAIQQLNTIVRNTAQPTYSAGAHSVIYPAVGPNFTGYGDWDRINYYTPRLAGFQFGITYTPEVCEGLAVSAGAGGITGAAGAGAITGGIGQLAGVAQIGNVGGAAGGGACAAFSPAVNAGQQGDLATIAVNYVQKFGPVDVGAAWFWTKGNLEGTTGLGSANGIFQTDRKEMGFGLNLSAMGVTLGGGWRTDNKGVRSNNTDKTDWNVGVRYRTGPWQVGVDYARGEQGNGIVTVATNGLAAGSRAGDDTAEVFNFGVEYTMGPGITFYGGVQYFNLDDNFGNPANENDGVLFILGTLFVF